MEGRSISAQVDCVCASLCGEKLDEKTRAWCHCDVQKNKKLASQPVRGKLSVERAGVCLLESRC